MLWRNFQPRVVIGPAVAGVGLEDELQVGEAGIAERLSKSDHRGRLDLRFAREFGDTSEGNLLRMVDGEIRDLNQALGQAVPPLENEGPQLAEIARCGSGVQIGGGKRRLVLGILRLLRHMAVFHAHPIRSPPCGGTENRNPARHSLSGLRNQQRHGNTG
jgi:hypothetical protein